MGLFDRFRSKPKSQNQFENTVDTVSEDVDSVNFYREVSLEEKELVSVIASAIMAGEKTDSQFVVKEVIGIDTDKEIVAAIVSAIASGDNPDSHFVLKSIEEVKK